MVVNFWSLNQSQQNLVGNILKLSIESGENKFLLIFLNEELFSRQTLPKITSSLIFKEILPDYLQKMIIRYFYNKKDYGIQ